MKIETNSLILNAFTGTNKTIPVWFMRQAGRYLPEYQAIRSKHTLDECFSNSQLAAEITCQPIDILGVDAAILFADILTLPIQMNLNIHFDDKKGPVVDIERDILHNPSQIPDIDSVEHVEETIKLVKQRLNDRVPLIGFTGSPFTVLTYLIEGGSFQSPFKTCRFIHEHTECYHQLMEKLTKNTIAYYNCQKKAGINIFQLFDTWAGILRPADYAHWVLPYVKQIFAEIDLPSIYYLKNSHHLLALMDQTDADFLSVCHTVVLGHHFIIEKTKKGIQGNLFNGLLYADQSTLKKEVLDVLVGGSKHDRYIFNLNHGVYPDVDPDQLKRIVDYVHEFKRNE